MIRVDKYSPYINRFLQPDTLVSDPYNPQVWNRYAYVLNNPIRYNDPTGHIEACGEGLGVCKHADSILADFGIKTKGLGLKQKWSVAAAAASSGIKIYNAFSSTEGYDSPVDAFRKTHGNFSVEFDGNRSDCETIGSVIRCGSRALYRSAFIHEFGHVLDNHSGGLAHDLDAYDYTDGDQTYHIDGGQGNPWMRGSEGFLCVNNSSCMEHRPGMGYGDDPNCQGVGAQSSGCAKIEQWADLYMNWILDGTGDSNHGFATDPYGDARRKYMQQQFTWLFKNGYLP